MFATAGVIWPLHWENGYALIAPTQPGVVRVEIELDPGSSMSGRIVDPDGKPLAGAKAVGLGGQEFQPTTFPTDAFTAYALDHSRPRTMYFVHADRKLVGSVTVRGDEKEPPVAKLRPWSEVIGRVLDHDGKPVGKAQVWFQMAQSDKDESIRSKLYGHRHTTTTDADGRFRLPGMFPDYEFSVHVNKPGYRTLLSFGAATLKSGEVKDLGERRFADPRKLGE
jgi:hypothetical protein